MKIFDLCEAEYVTLEEYHNQLIDLWYPNEADEEKIKEELEKRLKTVIEKNVSLRYYRKDYGKIFNKEHNMWCSYISLVFDRQKLPPQVDILEDILSPVLKYPSIMGQYQYNTGMLNQQNAYGNAYGSMNTHSNPIITQSQMANSALRHLSQSYNLANVYGYANMQHTSGTNIYFKTEEYKIEERPSAWSQFKALIKVLINKITHNISRDVDKKDMEGSK